MGRVRGKVVGDKRIIHFGYIYRKLRFFLCRLLGFFLIKTGFVQKKINKIKSRHLITILYFHNPSAELFAGCIRWLVKNQYVFISMQELYDILTNHIDPPVGSVCLTVDDGWMANLSNIVPVIDRYRIPICFFISTGPVNDGVFWWSICSRAKTLRADKSISIRKFKILPNSERIMRVNELKKITDLDREAMTKEDVIGISNNPYVTIGSHTINHPCLNQCSEDEVAFEITESKLMLSEWIQKDVFYFSYPNGDYTGSERNILVKSGYLMAFTTEGAFVIPDCHDIFYLPRLCINDSGSLEENICKMVGLWPDFRKFFARPRKEKVRNEH
jgi:peptidoglycan/xylan/chitin deacetylase (PgdA/CDA1 family)